MQRFREWRCCLFVIVVVLLAHVAHSNDVINTAQFDACVVYTTIDDFTDEERHRLVCKYDATTWRQDWLGVGCYAEDMWVTFLKPYEHVFHREDTIRVKYRFDRLAVRLGYWRWSDEGYAYTFAKGYVDEILQGVETAGRLVFQIDDERGRIEFADSDAHAVDDFTQRCAESFGQPVWTSPAVSRPTAPAQPAPAPVIANREPPPPAVSREQAAAATQALARAALKPLAPTPDEGEAPTNFGTPVVGPAATYDEAATQRKIAGIDQTLAAGSPTGGSAPADGYLADGTARGSALGGGSWGVMWDGDGAGCGKPVVDPKPVVSGITGGGVTYHIEVQFRVDATGLVTGVDIVKGGNREVNSAVLSAARGMRFDCTAEARGRRTYEMRPGGR